VREAGLPVGGGSSDGKQTQSVRKPSFAEPPRRTTGLSNPG